MATRKVVISPGYGAGWSTWNPDHRIEFLFNPVLIEELENDVPDAVERFEAYINEKYPGNTCYYGGGRDLKVVEVDGRFIVDEYDGYESIKMAQGVAWL